MNNADVGIVGGGIIGLATGWELVRRGNRGKVLVFEKEDELATHQTGRNSGVLHSGIYYKPGSLKAKCCRAGKQKLTQFCQEQEVALELCGKVIVAVDETEISPLEKLLTRGKENGVTCERIDVQQLAQIEPHVRGVAAIHVAETGIVDFVGVCQKFADGIRGAGGEVRTAAKVVEISSAKSGTERIVTISNGEKFHCKQLINCAGLQSDRVAKLGGVDPAAKIVPFRGEYFTLTSAAEHLCRHLIYPVPDPRFPFLGVHFTRMVAGGIECGPNAVPALAREGYGKLSVNLRDAAEALTYPGFLKLGFKHWRMGAGEVWRSLNKAAFVRALQRLIPEIEAKHLRPAPAGVRAQAVLPDGSLCDDFLIQTADGMVNVCNAPSPAATACMEIATHVADAAEAE